MLEGSVNSINRSNAAFARDLEYMREAMLDNDLDDRLEALERADGEIDTVDELLEAKGYVERLSDEDTFSEAEIDRILEADHDLTFNEMVGIEE